MEEITNKVEHTELQGQEVGLKSMNENLEQTQDISPQEISDTMEDFEASIDSRLNMNEAKKNFDNQMDGLNAHDTQTDDKVLQSNAVTNQTKVAFGYGPCAQLCRTTRTEVGYYD